MPGPLTLIALAMLLALAYLAGHDRGYAKRADDIREGEARQRMRTSALRHELITRARERA